MKSFNVVTLGKRDIWNRDFKEAAQRLPALRNMVLQKPVAGNQATYLSIVLLKDGFPVSSEIAIEETVPCEVKHRREQRHNVIHKRECVNDSAFVPCLNRLHY